MMHKRGARAPGLRPSGRADERRKFGFFRLFPSHVVSYNRGKPAAAKHGL